MVEKVPSGSVVLVGRFSTSYVVTVGATESNVVVVNAGFRVVLAAPLGSVIGKNVLTARPRASRSTRPDMIITSAGALVGPVETAASILVSITRSSLSVKVIV